MPKDVHGHVAAQEDSAVAARGEGPHSVVGLQEGLPMASGEGVGSRRQDRHRQC